MGESRWKWISTRHCSSGTRFERGIRLLWRKGGRNSGRSLRGRTGAPARRERYRNGSLWRGGKAREPIGRRRAGRPSGGTERWRLVRVRIRSLGASGRTGAWRRSKLRRTFGAKVEALWSFRVKERTSPFWECANYSE